MKSDAKRVDVSAILTAARFATIIAVGMIARAGLAQPAPLVLSAPPVPFIAAKPIETPVEALQADALEFASTYRIAPSEALRRLQAQEASVALIDGLVANYTDRLAGVFIEHAPIYRIVIVVTGTPSPDTQIATAPFDVPVILRTGAVSTRAEVLQAIEVHQADLRRALASPPGMGVDPHTGALLIVTKADDLSSDADHAEMEIRLAAIAGVPVVLKSWGDFDANLSAEGGGRLIGSDAEGTRRFVCTSGFVVTDGVRTGLSTAAHCPDTLDYVADDGTHTPLTMIGAWGARYQDVQIHVAGNEIQPAFYADNAIRARTAITWRNRASTRVGDVVCHRGQRTGYSCSVVRLVDYAPPGDLCAGPCPATWVAVSGPTCKGGDSGGPVFLGTTAFGLVKGESTVRGTCKLYYYMSIDYLPPGWTVQHGGKTPDQSGLQPPMIGVDRPTN